MSFARNSISILALSSVLLMGACSPKDKGSNEIKSLEGSQRLTKTAVDKNQITKLMKTKSRSVDEVNAQTALKALGLGESDKDTTSWTSRSGDKGNYVFTGVLSQIGDGKALHIAKLTLDGVRMEGEQATFDRLDANDLSVQVEEDTNLSIKHLAMTYPNAALSASITQSLLTMEDAKDFENMDASSVGEDGHLGIGGLWVQDLNLADKEVHVDLEAFGWAEDRDSKKAIFKMDGLLVKGKNDDQPMRITLDSIAATGVNVAYISNMQAMQRGIRTDFRGAGLKGMNPFAQTFEDFTLKNFDMFADGLSVKTKGVTANSRVKGDVTTLYQTMDPLTFNFSAEPKNRNMAEAHKLMQEMGYEKLEFTASQISQLNEAQDTASVTGANFSLKDGFDMKYSYSASGLKDFMSASLAAEGDPKMATKAMQALKLSKADFTLTDKSLLDRALKVIAKKQDSTEEMLRMQAKGFVSMMAFGAKNDAEARTYSQLGEALGGFIEKGGSIHFNMTPETPVSMGSLVSKGMPDLEKLAISVTHEP